MKGKVLPGNKILKTFLTFQCTIFTLFVHLLQSTKIFQKPTFNWVFLIKMFFP